MKAIINEAFAVLEVYWTSISAVLLLIITVLSLTPLSELPAVPGSDKLHHLIAYGALVFPVAFIRPRNWMLFALGFAAWSGMIELLQPYANRYGEWSDMLANMIGLTLGIVVAMLVRRWRSIE